VDPWKRNLYAVWLCQVLTMMGFGFVLPFIPFYIQHLGVTEPSAVRAWTGAISGAPGIVMGLVAPVWGYLADRHGRRIMVLRATAAGAIGLAALAFAPNVQTVFVLRLVQGLFAGTIAAASTLVASGTPRDRIAYAMGLIASSAFVGNAMGPSIGGLCAEWLGYRTTFFIGSGIVALGFLMVLLFVDESDAPIEQRTGGDGGVPFTVGMMLRQPFLPMFLMFFALRFARNLPGPFVSLYIQETRGTIQGASAITGALSAAVGVLTAISGAMLGRFGDRHDKLKLLTVFVALSAATALPIFFVPGAWSFAFFYIASAVFLGPTNPLLESTMTLITSSTTRGVLFGVEAFMGSMAMACAPFFGSAVTIKFSLKHIFLAFGLALVAAVGVAELSRRAARAYDATTAAARAPVATGGIDVGDGAG
jgi:MFS transporter, DHA1 family, multidrug resistance protein